MAKFRKDDLKFIVKELVRESLLEILAEEYIEEATFRAVENASSQIVGTVSKQIDSQLKPILEQLQGKSSNNQIKETISSVKLSSMKEYDEDDDDDYDDYDDEDYDDDYDDEDYDGDDDEGSDEDSDEDDDEKYSVSENLGLSSLIDPNSPEYIIASVRSQMQKEREQMQNNTSVESLIGLDDEVSASKGPTPTKSTQALGNDFQSLIRASSDTLREQTESALNSVGTDMFNIAGTKGTVASIEQKADPLFFKKIVDRVNSRTSSSPILGGHLAEAQKAHAQAQMIKIADSDLDRPAHEVSKYAK